MKKDNNIDELKEFTKKWARENGYKAIEVEAGSKEFSKEYKEEKDKEEVDDYLKYCDN